MSLPVGLATVTVQCGPYTDATGLPYAGRVILSPSVSVVHAATGAVILAGDVVARLDATGYATVVLPATDATGLTVAGFTYTASFDLRSASGEPGARAAFSLVLPSAVPVVDLDLLAPVEASNGVTVASPAVLSVAGLTGVISTSALVAAAALATDAELAAAVAPLATSAAMTAAISAALAIIDGGTP